jgi:hypothetical protein
MPYSDRAARSSARELHSRPAGQRRSLRLAAKITGTGCRTFLPLHVGNWLTFRFAARPSDVLLQRQTRGCLRGRNPGWRPSRNGTAPAISLGAWPAGSGKPGREGELVAILTSLKARPATALCADGWPAPRWCRPARPRPQDQGKPGRGRIRWRPGCRTRRTDDGGSPRVRITITGPQTVPAGRKARFGACPASTVAARPDPSEFSSLVILAPASGRASARGRMGVPAGNAGLSFPPA